MHLIHPVKSQKAIDQAIQYTEIVKFEVVLIILNAVVQSQR